MNSCLWSSLRLENKSQKISAIFLISIFLILRLGLETFWRSVSEYYSYLFEVIFVLTTYFCYRKNIRIWKNITLKDFLISSGALISGFLVYKMAGPFGLIIPFDFHSLITLFFLLVVAPLLEELLFRMALWESLKAIYSKDWFLIATTTILFSVGHLLSYWFVPSEFKTFVLYQSIYVIFLSFALGWQRLKTNSLSVPILIHFMFNLGFALASF